jgi:hypothetical protein
MAGNVLFAGALLFYTQKAKQKARASKERRVGDDEGKNGEKRTQSAHTIGVWGATSFVSALTQFMLWAVLLLYAIVVVQAQLQKGFIYTNTQVCEAVPRTRSLFGSLLSILGMAPGSKVGSLLSFLGFFKKKVRCYAVVEQIEKSDDEIFVQALIGLVVMIRGIFGLVLSLMFDYSTYDNVLKSVSLKSGSLEYASLKSVSL